MFLRAFLPTDAWVRWLLVPAAAFIALAGNTSYLADYWHHLARGRAIVEQGRLLDEDIFTCTVAGTHFQDVNWLSQVIYFQLHEVGGLALVRVVNAGLVALTLFWLLAICRRVSGSLPIGLGVGIAVFLGIWDVLTIRPQTFSLLLFIAIYDILDRSERSPWLLVIPPLLTGLWANLHGAFPAGIMLVGCWWAAAGWRWLRSRPTESFPWAYTACLGATCLATLVNPYGWEIYRYVGQTSTLAAARGIDEWLPPGFDQVIGWAFFLSVAVLGTLIWLTRKSRRSITARDLFLICCFLPLACGSVRMVAWWLLVIAPIIAARIAVLWPKAAVANEFVPNRGAAWSVAGLVLAMIFSMPGLQHLNPLIRLRGSDVTTANVDQAQALLARDLGEARVFSRFEWGEYLSWAAHPRLKVFMDGRIEIYPDDVWQAYAEVTCGKAGWTQVLDDYRIDALLLDAGYHRRTGLLEQVERSPGWQRQYEIGNAVVYVRNAALAQSARPR